MLFAMYPFTVQAGTRVVDSVEIESQPDKSEIHIRFNLPLQYITHTPIRNGRVLQVMMKPTSSSNTKMEDLITHETLRWEPDRSVPLSEISYEAGAPSGVNLIFRFSKTVSFRVVSGSDPRSLVVAILSDRADKPLSPSLEKRTEIGKEVQQSALPTIAESTEVTKPGKHTQPPARTKTEDEPSYYYAINLISSLEPIDPSTLDKSEIPENYRLYTTRFEKDGKTWHRLRLGFFPTQEAARQVMDSMRRRYSGAWVTRVKGVAARKILPIQGTASVVTAVTGGIPVPKPEIPLSSAVKKTPPQPQTREETPSPSHQTAPASGSQDQPGLTALDKSGEAQPLAPGAKEKFSPLPTPEDERLQDLMDEAKVAMTAGNFRRAIQLYTKVLQFPSHRFLPEAQELLGLARERNNQLAHAKAEYEKYLELYPEGEAADRVRQRLAGLLTARKTPKGKLRQAKKVQDKTGWQKDVYGSFSQFYNRDESYTDLVGKTVNQSLLNSDLDINTRMRSDKFDISTLFIGGHEKDFRDESDDRSRVSALYLDMLARRINLSTRMGRQSRSTGGVLGRFDGGLITYQPFSQLSANVVSGYPVESSSTTHIVNDKYFYGLSFDLGTFAEKWDFNTFIIDQEVNGISDRRAVGGEVRYFSPSRSFFSLVDYDTSYHELNLLLITANLTFPDKTTLNLSIDSRMSPILTTSNALQGQGVETVAILLDTYSEDEIRKLAEDRTATLRTYTVGLSRPLHEKLQISVDAAFSRMAGTKASGGVEASPGTGTDAFYSIQFIGSSLIKEGDIAIIGLRYSDTSTSKTTSLNLNTRYPLRREWKINPRLRIDYRENTRNNNEQLKFRPSFRMDYRWRRRLRFELEGGAEWATDKIFQTNEEEKTRGYFWTVGYRIDF
jgi:hypothetical protein